MINKNKFGMSIVLISLAFFALFFITNTSAKLAFDNDCPVSSTNYVNFSNGTAIFLPFTYNETSTTNSNMTIFLGTNTNYFCSAINENLSSFSQNRTVIFTPEFLNALKTSSCSATFENYMDNYRKSGDLLNSDGTVFCGVRNLTFDATTNPSGITFNYTIAGVPVGINGTNYNGPSLKKYMIAYLMNHPDAEISGVISTFANAINLNVSLSCPGTSSITDFFNSGKGNYTSKFKPALLGINWTAGEKLEPSDGVGGVFGWLLDYALGNQVLPIITAANLSTNKIYVCGVVILSNALTNSSVTITTNTTTIDATTTVNTTLEIATNGSVTNATVELVAYSENPQTSGAVGVTALNRYVGIRIDNALKNVLSSVIIKIYYTDSEVSAAGVQEDTLRLYYYNETSSSWQKYDDPNGGVNTTGNYVWANTTHFSNWGIFGFALASATTTSMAGGGGICNRGIWGCNSWSECLDGKQSRNCVDKGFCKFKDKFETRDCFELGSNSSIPVSQPIPVKISEPSSAIALAVPLGTLWPSMAAIAIILTIISWRILAKKKQAKKKKLAGKKKRQHVRKRKYHKR